MTVTCRLTRLGRCDNEQSTEWIERAAIGSCRVRRAKAASILGEVGCALVRVEAFEYRPETRAFHPFEHRILAFEHLQILGLPDVDASGGCRKEIVIDGGAGDPVPGDPLPQSLGG